MEQTLVKTACRFEPTCSGYFIIDSKNLSYMAYNNDSPEKVSLESHIYKTTQSLQTSINAKVDKATFTEKTIGAYAYSYFSSNNTQYYYLLKNSLDYIASDNNKKETIKNSLTSIIGETGSSTSIITSDDIFDAINSYVKENSQYKNFDLFEFIVETCNSLNMEVPTTSQLK